MHDSDYAKINYWPESAGTGVAYLNDSDRGYFDQDGPLTNAEVESDGLASWWAIRHGREGFVDEVADKRAQLKSVLFDDENPPEKNDDEDADYIAEIKLRTLANILDLPELDLDF